MAKYLIFILITLFIIVNCGDPTKPETINKINDGGYKIIAKLKTAGYAQDVEVKNNLAYIAQGEGGLAIVDFTDPASPIYLSNTFDELEGYFTKIAVKDSSVYMTAGTYGVSIVNAANPRAPFMVKTNLNIKPARDILLTDNWVFTCISSEGIIFHNIEDNLFAPDPRAGIPSLPGYARSAAITKDSMLCVASGEMGLSIFDVSKIDSLNGFDDYPGGNYPLLGWANTPGYAQAIEIIDDNEVAVMACGTEGLQIVSYADTSNIHIVGSYDTGGYAKELYYENNLIYVTTETRGVQIFSITDVSNPQLLGVVETKHALGITADEHHIYIADKEEGLIIIKKP